MTDEAKSEKPKRVRKAAIVPLPPPVELRLGALAISDPKEMISRAASLASALAEIIHSQKDLEGKPTMYVMIKGKKFVRVEGWTTLGAMLGVVPIEEYCNPLVENEGKGYRAKVNLVRINDGMQVGGASAICKLTEKGWDAEDYATHSKAISRATGKAFRLSFAWIMKLAGFEPTPADEIFEVEGSEQEAQQVAKDKEIEREAKKQGRKEAKTCVFIAWPEEHHGHNFFVTGKTVIMESGLMKDIEARGGRWNDREGGWFVSAEHADDLRFIITERIGTDRLIERQLGKSA